MRIFERGEGVGTQHHRLTQARPPLHVRRGHQAGSKPVTGGGPTVTIAAVGPRHAVVRSCREPGVTVRVGNQEAGHSDAWLELRLPLTIADLNLVEAGGEWTVRRGRTRTAAAPRRATRSSGPGGPGRPVPRGRADGPDEPGFWYASRRIGPRTPDPRRGRTGRRCGPVGFRAMSSRCQARGWRG